MVDLLLEIYKRSETVFTVSMLEQLAGGVSGNRLRDRLRYYVRVGKLLRAVQGVYVKPGFEPLELGNKLYTPSYVSLETILLREGITFQAYFTTYFLISYLTRERKVGNYSYHYRRIKNSILTNTTGVVENNGVFEATKERAFLDALYIYKDYHFDNLGGLDWNKIRDWVELYESETMKARVESYYRDYQEEWDVKR